MTSLPPSRPLKILMLHGYTQSGPMFRAKSRALEKHVQKAFPGSTLTYPTAPLRLRPSDVPTTTSQDEEGERKGEDEDEDQIEAYGWWRRRSSTTTDPPEYMGLEDGLATVAETLSRALNSTASADTTTTTTTETDGPFDGVIGFSQGGALAAMVASLLQGGPERRRAFDELRSRSSRSCSCSSPSGCCSCSSSVSSCSSSLSIPFPSSFDTAHLHRHPPLKFCIVYSGFVAPGQRYAAFYDPRIDTPSCHFIGSLDSVVEEGRCRALFDAFAPAAPAILAGGDDDEGRKEGKVLRRLVYHPGGHFLPSSRLYLDAVVGFIRDVVGGGPGLREQSQEKIVDKVEDMEMPF